MEEVTFVPRAQSAGANFGWPCFEGNQGGPQDCDRAELQAAGARLLADEPAGGGRLRRAPPEPRVLEGRYLFGRFGGPSSSDERGRGNGHGTGLNIPSLTSFGEDGVGRLYVTGMGNYVARLVGAGGALTAEPIPGDFGQPSAVAAPYGDPDRLFIAELGGGLYLRTGGQNHLFIGLNPIVSTGGEAGPAVRCGRARLRHLRSRVRLLRRQRRQPRRRRAAPLGIRPELGRSGVTPQHHHDRAPAGRRITTAASCSSAPTATCTSR